jgi:hypothetical protein
MRMSVLMVLAITLVSWAQIFPRIMTIYKQDGGIDTFSCSRLDTARGATFSDTKMHIATLDGRDDSICTALIDSITFPFAGGPPYQIMQPTRGREFHLGDSLTVQWKINRSIVSEKAYLVMSTNGGRNFGISITNNTCFIQWKDPRSGPCWFQSVPYPPYPYVGDIGTYTFKLTDPLVLPDPDATAYNASLGIVCDSVVIKIIDYEYSDFSATSEMFAIKP